MISANPTKLDTHNPKDLKNGLYNTIIYKLISLIKRFPMQLDNVNF